MRVSYGAVLEGCTLHLPSDDRGFAAVYAVAVPLTRYSLSAYPTLARSMVVVVSAGVLLPPVTGPPVTGPVTVGTGCAPVAAAAGTVSAGATSAY